MTISQLFHLFDKTYNLPIKVYTKKTRQMVWINFAVGGSLRRLYWFCVFW